MIRRRCWNPSRYQKSEALAKIREPACPVCAHYPKEVIRHFFWFTSEQYYEAETIMELRRSFGFCPIHTRHLLRTEARSVITYVFSYLTEHVITRLRDSQAILRQGGSRLDPRGKCRQAAEVLRPRGACRACKDLQWWEDYIIYLLLQTLTDAEVQSAYQSSRGLCLPHFRQVGLLADWDSLRFLTEDARRRFMVEPDGPGVAFLEKTIGLDKDRALRRWDGGDKSSDPSSLEKRDVAAVSHRESNSAAAWSPAFDRIRIDLAEPGCPVCAACEQGLQNYFRWLGSEMQAIHSTSGNWDLSWSLCPLHLWDFHASGYERPAAIVAERIRIEWLWRLDFLASGLASRPSSRWAERFAEAVSAWSHQCGGSIVA